MIVSRRAALLGGGSLLAAGSASAQVVEPPFEAEALAWVRRAARRIDDESPSIASLQPMVAALAGARVLGLGEATHGSHEDFEFKACLFRALIALGDLRVVALECNHQPGLAFDRYVREGGGDPIELIRTSGFFQNWQCEEFGGLLTWIRAWNASGKPTVRIVGIDCQATGPDAAFALEWLRKRDAAAADALAERLKALIAPEVVRTRLYDVLVKLDRPAWERLMAALKALEERLGGDASWAKEPGFADARHAARTAIQGLLTFEQEVPGAPKAASPEVYWSRRDRFMADNLLALAGDARTGLWAHNVHVLPINFPGTEVGTSGWFLKSGLGAAYRTVAFEWDRGLIHAKTTKPDTPPPPHSAPWRVVPRPSWPGGLGAFLAKAGPERFWLEVGKAPETAGIKAWKDHGYLHDWPGFVVYEGQGLSDQDRLPVSLFDVLVFFRTMTPSRLYGFVPQA